MRLDDTADDVALLAAELPQDRVVGDVAQKRRRIRVLRNEGTRQVEYRFDYEAFLNGAAPAISS